MDDPTRFIKYTCLTAFFSLCAFAPGAQAATAQMQATAYIIRSVSIDQEIEARQSNHPTHRAASVTILTTPQNVRALVLNYE